MPSITHDPALCHDAPAGAEEVILGVDTHKDVHAAAVVTTLGAALDGRSFPATAEGYRQLVIWARSFGTLRRAGVECTGSYGAALTRHLRTEGIEVIEVNQPDRAERRRRGKTDAIDAEAAARAVLSGRATASAKTGDGPVEMLRLFKLAKSSAIKSQKPGDQPAQGGSGRRRPRAARGRIRLEQRPAVSLVRRPRDHVRDRRQPGRAPYAAAARPPDRASDRGDR